MGEPRQAGTYASAVTYHPNGAMAEFTYGNGIHHRMTQNTRGLTHVANDAGVMNDIYTYDNNGNVQAIDDQFQGLNTRSMGYDGLNRLTTVAAGNLWGNVVYGYDTLDNLVSTAAASGQNARYTVHSIDHAKNRLDSISNGPSRFNFTFGYDGHGNVVNRGGQVYSFDLGNRMNAAVGRATYVYDGLGRRVSIVGTDGVNRIQVYSQDGKLMYAAPSGGPGTKYIYLNRHQIAEVH